MEKYQSKQHQIHRPAAAVYGVVSDFRNFTPILQDKVEGWQADADTCSFKAKGFQIRLRIAERKKDELIKVEGEDGSPMDFTFWIQLKEIGENDTRMRIVLHVKLNMMMKMMLGGKLQEAIDQIALQVANAFNGIMPEGFTPPTYMADNSGNVIPDKKIDDNDFDDPYFIMPDPDKPAS